jgi:hypothetical protein
MTMLIVSIKFYLLQGYFRYIDLQIEINSENETLLQKRWFQFSHCEQLYIAI